MCVYCENVYEAGTVVCPVCEEYDGLMPVAQAVDYLDLDRNDFPGYFQEDYL